MQISSSIPSSVEQSLESFDELNSVSVVRGFSSNATVENEFGSFIASADLDETVLSRLSTTLGKYYTWNEPCSTEKFDNVLDLMHHLKFKHCKPTIKYSAQQVFEAALVVRDNHAIMIALSGCQEFNDNIINIWTGIVINGVEKVLEKIKTVGKKKSSRQEFINEWNYIVSFFRMQYDGGVLEKNIVVNWCLKVLQKCGSEQIYVFLMTIKGIIGDFAMSVG